MERPRRFASFAQLTCLALVTLTGCSVTRSRQMSAHEVPHRVKNVTPEQPVRSVRPVADQASRDSADSTPTPRRSALTGIRKVTSSTVKIGAVPFKIDATPLSI